MSEHDSVAHEDRISSPALEAKRQAEADQAIAEAERIRAETLKLRAETREAEAKAKIAEDEAVVQAMRREMRELEWKLEMSHNRWNHVYLFDQPVRPDSAKACMDQLTVWERTEPGCALEIRFLSPGGSIIDGMALYDYIQRLRRAGHKVTTVAYGMAASMAGILLQAGDVRIMTKESWLLIHEASFVAGGSMGNVEDTVEWVKKIQQRILAIFAERSHLTKRQVEARWKRKDWWLSSDEALALGLVDEVR